MSTFRKPPTAYLFYMAFRRPELKMQEPCMNFAQLTYTIADEWHNMSEEEKMPYIQLAQMGGEN